MAFKAELLRASLKEAGKTQSFLSEVTGKTERTVSRWLNAGSHPKSKDLQAIAKALGCTPQDFDPSFADEGQGEVAIHARVSVASHNAYELMRLRYGATQKEIIELAPVLFSIVAGHALRVPDEDIAIAVEASRLGLYCQLAGNVEDAYGFDIDQQASKDKKCFGVFPPDPMKASPRNLFHEAISRLCYDIKNDVDPKYHVSPDPGEAPSSAGFIPDVAMLNQITGGNDELIEALTKGRIRLSKCLEDDERGEEALIDVLRRELGRKNDEHGTQVSEKREKGLVKLKAWRAFYEEHHPELAREYDQIAEEHCQEDGWYPPSYDDDLREKLWTDPYEENRYINEETLPEYQKKCAESSKGSFTFNMPEFDPIYRRFEQLKAHRKQTKADFEEVWK